jgi:hypothetical protein
LRVALVGSCIGVVYASVATIVLSAYDEVGSRSPARPALLIAAPAVALKMPAATASPEQMTVPSALAPGEVTAAAVKLSLQPRINAAAGSAEPVGQAVAAFTVAALALAREALPEARRPTPTPDDVVVAAAPQAVRPQPAAQAPRPAFKPLAAYAPPTRTAAPARSDPLDSFWSSLKALLTGRPAPRLPRGGNDRDQTAGQRSVAALTDPPAPARGDAVDPGDRPAPDAPSGGGTGGGGTGTGGGSTGAGPGNPGTATGSPGGGSIGAATGDRGSEGSGGDRGGGGSDDRGDRGQGGDRDGGQGRGGDHGKGGDKGKGGDNGKGGDKGGGNGKGGGHGNGNGGGGKGGKK